MKIRTGNPFELVRTHRWSTLRKTMNAHRVREYPRARIAWLLGLVAACSSARAGVPSRSTEATTSPLETPAPRTTAATSTDTTSGEPPELLAGVTVDGETCELRRLAAFPTGMRGVELGHPQDVPLKDRGKGGGGSPLCATGHFSTLAAAGHVHTIRAVQPCEEPVDLPACNAGYVALLETALGVAHQPAPELALATAPTEGRRAPVVFDSDAAVLRVDFDAGSEGVELTELALIAKSPGSVCHSRDGFAEFFASLLDAIEKDDRERVADHFAFPFADETQQGDLAFDNRQQFLARYGRLITKPHGGRDGRPRRYPTHPVCRVSWGGYVDHSWTTGAMVARRADGEWRWVANRYVP